MYRRAIIGLSIFAAFAVGFGACSKNNKNEEEDNDRIFDKAAMLVYYADQQIIPGFASLQQKINTLQTAVVAFVDDPSDARQATALQAFKDAHLQFQSVEAFSFGPSASASYNAYMNFTGGLVSSDILLNGFSIDIATIEDNIASGTYDLSAYDNNSFYSQGFPALSYLLFEANAISKLSVNGTNRKKYGKDLVARMKLLTDKMVADWAGYRAAFIANTQSNVGSPIGNMVNSMAYEMDLLKGPRIGWPFGKQSNGQVFETKVEGYYTGNSVALATANLKSLKLLYAGGSGKGFADYLNALNKQSLNSSIAAQFDVAISRLEAIPDPLSNSLTAKADAVNAAYGEIQKLLTLLKTDLASALGVQISFMDNDGD